MTDNDVYQFIKKKVHEGIEKDKAIENEKIEDLEEIDRTYKFLEEFYKEHNEKMKQFRFIDENWLNSASEHLWTREEYWKKRQIWAERDHQYQWCLNFREGHHTTGPLSYNQIAYGCGGTVNHVKIFLSHLERDNLIGKIKFNGFFPYWWYLIE